MKTAHRILAGCLASLLLSAAARASEWTEDYASALARARKEHKLLLLDFTGSDWCSWCHRTDTEVFATRKFEEFADQKLILVKLDFPRARELPAEVRTQNARLKVKYEVKGYPTLIVLDTHEKVVFEQEGYEEGGPDAFLAKFPKPAN